MSIQTLGRTVGILTVCLLAYFGFRLATQWRAEPVGPYQIRRNTLTGLVQIKTPTGWDAFSEDPYASSASADDLRRVQITDVVWAEGGVLCARAIVAPPASRPVTGRVAFLVRIYDKEQKRVIDKAIRTNVNFDGGSTVPFVLRTTIPTADTKDSKTTIRLLPALYSGA